MFCKNCGKQIPEVSKFCQNCGTKISDESSTKNDSSENMGLKLLWEKFAEVYNSVGDERQKYLDLSSNEAWELINRLGTNSFETFIEEHKEALNKLPYKSIEALKATYNQSTYGGYWLWVSETLLKNGSLSELKPIDLQELIDKWKITAIEKYSDSKELISEEQMSAMNTFYESRVENVFENSPELKELSNEIIEKLKSALILQILWGYYVGVTESLYRK